jgi:hypothetical protein
MTKWIPASNAAMFSPSLTNKSMPTQEKKLPFKVGCDPEFSIIYQDKRACAEDLFRYSLTDKLTAVDNGFKVGNHGNIGWDGAHQTGEIRPAPSSKPSDVVKNLHALFSSAFQLTAGSGLMKFTTQSSHAPIGGHIHLELTDEQKTYSPQKFKSIHKILSSYYLPLLMGDNKLNLKVRLKSPYGRITDFRTENEKTFEFRAPSAEWLTTPEIAEATLTYMGVLWHEVTRHPETFKNDEFVYRTDQQGLSIQELLVNQYDVLGKTLLREIRKRVRAFELYPVFATEIEYIMNHEKVLKDKETAEHDINLGWKLVKPMAMPTKLEVNNKTLMNSKLVDMNIDFMLKLINFSYNQDVNVNIFAQELKKKVIAFNWRLKHNYFFFGLRKGVDEYFVQEAELGWLKGHEQFKGKSDANIMEDVFTRMKQRLIPRQMQNMHKGKSIKNILIGIPYVDRIKEDTAKFINLIHDLEREAMVPAIVDADTLPNTKGPITIAYSKDEPGEVAIDASMETVNLLHEIQQEEAINNDTNNKNLCAE